MNALAQKRHPKRAKVFLRGRMRTDAGAREIRVRDVSSAGALIEAADPPATGETLSVACGEIAMHGTVAWSEGTWFGMEFSEPLDVETLADEIGNSLRVSAPRTYRQGDIPAEEEVLELDARKIEFPGSAG